MPDEARRRIQAQIELLQKELHNVSNDLEFEARLRQIKDLRDLLKSAARQGRKGDKFD